MKAFGRRNPARAALRISFATQPQGFVRPCDAMMCTGELFIDRKRDIMELKRHYQTDADIPEVRRNVISYFKGLGYRLSSSSPALEFERGSTRGSWLSSAPQKWAARLSVQIAPDIHRSTRVVAEADFNTRGQILLPEEKMILEREMDGLAKAIAPNGAGTEPVADDLAVSEARFKAQKQLKSGASWFFWIAGLSLVNSAIFLFGGEWNFILGMGITQVFDGMAMALGSELGSEAAWVLKGVAFLLDLGAAGLFAFFGYFARKGAKWSFLIGMVLYTIDGLIFLAVSDFLGAGFHLFALFWIFMGMMAAEKLRKLDQAQAIAV